MVYKGESCCTTVVSKAQAKVLCMITGQPGACGRRHVDVVSEALLTHAPAPVIIDTPATSSTAELVVLLSVNHSRYPFVRQRRSLDFSTLYYM